MGPAVDWEGMSLVQLTVYLATHPSAQLLSSMPRAARLRIAMVASYEDPDAEKILLSLFETWNTSEEFDELILHLPLNPEIRTKAKTILFNRLKSGQISGKSLVRTGQDFYRIMRHLPPEPARLFMRALSEAGFSLRALLHNPSDRIWVQRALKHLETSKDFGHGKIYAPPIRDLHSNPHHTKGAFHEPQGMRSLNPHHKDVPALRALDEIMMHAKIRKQALKALFIKTGVRSVEQWTALVIQQEIRRYRKERAQQHMPMEKTEKDFQDRAKDIRAYLQKKLRGLHAPLKISLHTRTFLAKEARSAPISVQELTVSSEAKATKPTRSLLAGLTAVIKRESQEQKDKDMENSGSKRKRLKPRKPGTEENSENEEK